MKKLLKEEGFTEVEREDGMVGKSFMIDRHCHDLLFFPNELLQYLDEANFMKNKLLISQVVLNWIFQIAVLICIRVMISLFY